MKYISKIVAFVMLFAMVACTPKGITDLEGTYGFITQVNNPAAVVGESQRVGTTRVKELNVNFKDAKGNTIDVKFFSTEWVLEKGEYQIGSYGIAGFSNVKFNNKEAVEGTVTVNVLGEEYYVTVLAYSANRAEGMHVVYKGALKFQDYGPDPSGITYTYTEAQVIDWSTGVPVPTEWISYTVHLHEGEVVVGELIFISAKAGMTLENWVGTHNVSNSNEEGIVNSMDYSLYGFAMGSYVMVNGQPRYSNKGDVTVTSVTSGDSRLYSFVISGWESGVEGDPNPVVNTEIRYCLPD